MAVETDLWWWELDKGFVYNVLRPETVVGRQEPAANVTFESCPHRHMPAS